MPLKSLSLQNESYNITKIYNDKVLLLENNSNSIKFIATTGKSTFKKF